MTTVDAIVNPEGSLEVLSQREVNELCDAADGALFEQFRRCCLAVLNSGAHVDDAHEVLAAHRDFQVELKQRERGIQIAVRNAPQTAFVDGKMIRGIRELLFAVLRDIVFHQRELRRGSFDLTTSAGITNAVFDILRNAHFLRAGLESKIVVCWGGHSISREEYAYTKRVGYELGLRGLHVCTGCGPGAMKGPMKGAAVAHAKQRSPYSRFLGITEPGIIAAEPPNPIVNELVIMPDMEKRLEAFMRIAHGFVIFPGGVGTAEELLYLLAVAMHPDNAEIELPLVLTGPESSRPYFDQVSAFVESTLGRAGLDRLVVIIDDPAEAARLLSRQIENIFQYRKQNDDAFYFNWRLKLDAELQKPFVPTHASIATLRLHREGSQPHLLAYHLRRAFSGIVAGNVKDEGIRLVEQHGPFVIHGETAVMDPLDRLLRAFVEQQRMRLPGREYVPCYTLSADKP